MQFVKNISSPRIDREKIALFCRYNITVGIVVLFFMCGKIYSSLKSHFFKYIIKWIYIFSNKIPGIYIYIYLSIVSFTILDHIEYLRDRIGVSRIGLGSDYNGGASYVPLYSQISGRFRYL